MTAAEDRLYDMLPAIYRIRDAEEGEPLKALLRVIQGEMDAVRKDVGGLYDNWFIETCDEWAVPYIGDVLGVRGLHPAIPGVFSLRPYVANTLSYRRRKGTAAVLEQLAHDVTGWSSRAVEYFTLLSVTQNLNHVRPRNTTVDLRGDMGLLGSPFEDASHTADIRPVDCGGKYNIPNVGIFLWRLQGYRLKRATARGDGSHKGRYFFSPLGLDMPLFNQPPPEEDISHIADEINSPGVLRRRPLFDELHAIRCALKAGKKPAYRYFSESPEASRAFAVFVKTGDEVNPVPPQNIFICDMSAPIDWRYFTAALAYACTGVPQEPEGVIVAVDPVRGRLQFPDGVVPDGVEVTCSYGFGGDIGGGPYDRSGSVDDAWRKSDVCHLGVSKTVKDPGVIFGTLSEALEQWNLNTGASRGLITIMDNATYDGPVSVKLDGRSLLIVAAYWPEEDHPDLPGVKIRTPGHFSAYDTRPCLSGDVTIEGGTVGGTGELCLNGLLIEGSIRIKPGQASAVDIEHCTVVPGKGRISVDYLTEGTPMPSQMDVSIGNSICGAIELQPAKSSSWKMPAVRKLSIADSVIDGIPANEGESAVSASGVEVDVQASTVFGRCSAGVLTAGNSIFTGKVNADRRQTGCVRYSHVPDGSATPRRYRCQPDLAFDRLAKKLGKSSSKALSEKERRQAVAKVAPSFTSCTYGDPGYAQLGMACPGEIRTGADDRSEQGAFYYLKQPHREANLRAVLDEYLRFGLEAGIFYVN